MNVSRIAKQKDTAGPEAVGNAMVDAVGREPMHGRDMELQMSDRPAADIVKAQFAVWIDTIAEDTDQPHTFAGLERKDDREILVLDVDMHRAIDRRPRRIDIGHIERA